MKTVLFQGDSITDMGRSREHDGGLGCGYANLTAGMLSLEYPGQLKIYNRGISGNRIVDLYSRIKSDVINLKPDYMSILIGVNDVWHELDLQNGVDAKKFRKIYEMYISEISEALPNTKIIIMEPFVLEGSATKDRIDIFRSEVQKRSEMAQEVAKEFNLPFVALQSKLEDLAKKIPPEQILGDGVHPAITGAAIISRELFDAYKKVIK